MDNTPRRETGKQRAQRIPLDYYRHPDRLSRTKTVLGWLALAVPVVWLGSGWLRGDGKKMYSRGPVAAVHATWDAKCEACHQPFTPVAGGTFLASFSSSEDKHHTGDQLCKRCHEGPDHHASQKTSEVQSCGACHRDHRGHEASLIRVADHDCLKCHRELQNHLSVDRQPLYENVNAFASRPENEDNASAGHPEFKLLREVGPSGKPQDPGKLKFNHALHMAAGMASPNGGGPVFKYSHIAETDRARYKPQAADGRPVSDNDYVQLDCKSCHRLQSEDFGVARESMADVPGAALPVRSAGAYMLPITYDNQCRACHPLNVEVATPQGEQVVSVPHRVQPDKMHSHLLGIYASAYLENNPELLEKSISRPRPLPGRDRDTGLEKLKHFLSDDEAADAQQAVRGQVHEAETLLYARVMKAEADLFRHKRFCGECHSYQMDGEQLTPDQVNEQTDVYLQQAAQEKGWPSAGPKFRIAPVDVPQVWFQHARFDHAAHRAVDCKLCHQSAYADAKDASIDSSDVMIPGIDNCLQCHAPAHTVAGEPRGGARFDCAECHRYHGGDHGGGIGSAGRGVHTPLTVPEFLSGERAPAEAP